jgi:hypothetical protein
MSISYPPEQIQELKEYCRNLLAFDESNVTYFLMEGIRLPDGCSPGECDAVLCPVDRGDGYASRLFFSARVTGLFDRNWHVTDVRLAERQWTAFSWKVKVPGLTLAQLVREHLSALVKPQ